MRRGEQECAKIFRIAVEREGGMRERISRRGRMKKTRRNGGWKHTHTRARVSTRARKKGEQRAAGRGDGGGNQGTQIAAAKKARALPSSLFLSPPRRRPPLAPRISRRNYCLYASVLRNRSFPMSEARPNRADYTPADDPVSRTAGYKPR